MKDVGETKYYTYMKKDILFGYDIYSLCFYFILFPQMKKFLPIFSKTMVIHVVYWIISFDGKFTILKIDFHLYIWYDKIGMIRNISSSICT